MKVKLKYILVIIFAIFLGLNSHSQETIKRPTQRNIVNSYAGLGVGLDFGGFGINCSYYFTDNFGIFGGLGYNLVDLGYNAGLKYRFLPSGESSLFMPFIMGMYGYNAVIAIEDYPDLGKIFYGPSFGLGIDWKGFEEKKFLWTVALILPIRSKEIQNYTEYLRLNHDANFKNELPPIAISFGIRF